MEAMSTATLAGVSSGLTMPTARLLRAYAGEIKYEAVRMLRAPAFSVPFLLLPVPVYMFFGVLLAAPAIANNPAVGNYLFSGFSAFAIIGPSLFGAGCSLAVERDAGLLRLKRALPAPPGAYLVAKIVVSMIFAALAASTLLVASLFTGTVTLSLAQRVALEMVMVVGAVPFAAIGLLIGTHASGTAAPAFANVVFLPMLWLSGLFIPLPKFLEPWALIWPAFHINQVALGAAGVTEFQFVSPLLSAAVLTSISVVCGGLAIRRLARKG